MNQQSKAGAGFCISCKKQAYDFFFNNEVKIGEIWVILKRRNNGGSWSASDLGIKDKRSFVSVFVFP